MCIDVDIEARQLPAPTLLIRYDRKYCCRRQCVPLAVLRTVMLEREDGDDFIAELIDELLENVDSVIYAKYIESQLVPYTVLQAKNAILQIIEVSLCF